MLVTTFLPVFMAVVSNMSHDKLEILFPGFNEEPESEWDSSTFSKDVDLEFIFDGEECNGRYRMFIDKRTAEMCIHVDRANDKLALAIEEHEIANGI